MTCARCGEPVSPVGNLSLVFSRGYMQKVVSFSGICSECYQELVDFTEKTVRNTNPTDFYDILSKSIKRAKNTKESVEEMDPNERKKILQDTRDKLMEIKRIAERMGLPPIDTIIMDPKLKKAMQDEFNENESKELK